MARLREAAGSSIDKVDGQLSKAISAIEKAQSAVLDAADAMDAVMVDAIACGGKVAELVPGHLKVHIASLTKIADQELGTIAKGDGQSSLNKLKDLIGNIPYRDLRQPSPQERREVLGAAPNLTGGPQSAISSGDPNKMNESLEDFYRNVLKEEVEDYEYDDNNFSFGKLKESNIFGTELDPDFMNIVGRKSGEVIQKVDRSRLREKMRAAADDVMFEDRELEPLKEDSERIGEKLPNGAFFNGQLKAFAGSDGIPLSFGALTEGTHLVS